MTRAERAMQLTAKMYIVDSLRAVVDTVFRVSYHDSGTLEIRREMGHERGELLRQMGASERREYERLLAAWKEPRPRNPAG